MKKNDGTSEDYAKMKKNSNWRFSTFGGGVTHRIRMMISDIAYNYRRVLRIKFFINFFTLRVLFFIDWRRTFLHVLQSKSSILHKCQDVCPFQRTFEDSRIFSSHRNLLNLFSSKGFVKISASCSSVLRCSIEMSPFHTWSRRKWWRIWMCFVFECWTGL